MGSPDMEYRILGPLEVIRDGQTVDLGRRRQRALLALLLLGANEVVSRERLIEELWGEAAPPSASNLIQVSVSRLRKALGREGVLVTKPPGYVIRVGVEELDALRFQGLVARARDAVGAGDPAGARELLCEAMSLWRGPPLFDFTYESFAQAEVARLEELRLDALELRIDADLAVGMDEALVGELERLVVSHPFRERLRAQLMLALYRSGRQAEALEAYRAARTALVGELGLEPSRALKRLEQSILAQDPTLELGDVERESPPRAPKAHPRHNLAAELTSLIGRDAEVAWVVGLLERHRLVTLAGAGGVGKTRVAQRVGSTVVGDYEDGVWVVDLAALDHGSEVAGAVMSSVAIRDRPGHETLDTVAQALRERGLLLVLDSCEHVLSAAAAVAARLLGECPAVRILATSREPLGIIGERAHRLEPLATTVNGGGEQPPAVKLFLDRAAMHGVRWEQPADVLDTVAEMCRRLDGIPLAIELAAARARALSPGDLLAHLDDRLRLLSRPAHSTVHARQQTLETTIAWSYGLLSEQDQATLRRLSVFRGGFSLAAASAVCADIGSELDTLERVALLVDRSVLSVQHRGDSDRYRLLESIGLFAEQRVRERSEQDAARDRHAQFFLELVQQASAELEGPQQQVWAGTLDLEKDNLAAALAWCLDGSGARMVGAELSAGVGAHWTLRGRSNLARQWLERAAQFGDELPPAVRVAVHLALFTLGWSTDDDEISSSSAIEAVRIARDSGDPQLLGESLARLVASHQDRGEGEAAAAVAAELRSLQDRIRTPKARIRALIGTARVALAQGDADQAVDDASRAREIARGAGDHWRAASSGYWLGYALAPGTDLTAARAAMQQAMRDAVRSGYEITIADTVNGVANIAVAQGDVQTARQLLPRAAEMFREQRRLADFGRALRIASLVELKRDRIERSAQLLGAGERWIGDRAEEFYKEMLLPELGSLPETLATKLGARAFAEARDRGAALTLEEALRLLAGRRPEGML